jgi:mRNA interferase RelE/StbE
LTTSKAKAVAQKPKYRLAFETNALKEWKALDGSVKEPLRKLLKKRLDGPRVPGAELHGELRDCYKIKLRKQDYRLVYRVVDDLLIVMVLAVDRREGETVYNAAIKRLRTLGQAAAAGAAAPLTKTGKKT